MSDAEFDPVNTLLDKIEKLNKEENDILEKLLEVQERMIDMLSELESYTLGPAN